MTKLHQLANKMCMMCRYGCPSLGKPLSEAVRTFRFHGWSTSTYIRVCPSSTVEMDKIQLEFPKIIMEYGIISKVLAQKSYIPRGSVWTAFFTNPKSAEP